MNELKGVAWWSRWWPVLPLVELGTRTEWPAASAESQIRRNFRYTGQIAASKPMNEIILSVPLNRANTL
eukprot:s10378_g1.t1